MGLCARLFHCAGCHCQVIICRGCDRGNVYCFKGCARDARRASLRDAAARYRNSRRGREANAARQRRYRARQQKVTHQGSATAADAASLQQDADGRAAEPGLTPPNTLNRTSEPPRCHGCGRPVSVYLRQQFLHTGTHRRRPP